MKTLLKTRSCLIVFEASYKCSSKLLETYITPRSMCMVEVL